MRWWRVFSDRKEDEAGDEGASERRRHAPRYGERLRVGVRCESWPDLAHLFTGNLSDNGLFVRCHEQGKVGEEVRIDLSLPSGLSIALLGRVANLVSPEEATRRGIAPGMGVKLDPLEGEARRTFDKLLASARAQLPRPAEQSADGQPRPAPPPRPPSIAPTDKVRHSTVMRAIDAAEILAHDESLGDVAAPPPSTAPRHGRKPSSGVVVGIDLGLGSTSVAALVGSKITVLSRADGSKQLPSVVHIGDDGVARVGEIARASLLEDPTRTVAGPRRLLGARFDDPEVAAWLRQRPLSSTAMADGTAAIVVGERGYTGVELCAHLLADARALAVEALGAPVSQAVVSVPLRWDEQRVDALRRAGELAGLDIVAVIDEPTAVALANRFDSGFGGQIGVFDLGGASCDFSILDVSLADFRVLATAGDANLGGEQIDLVLAHAANEHFQRRHAIDLARVPGAWPRLLDACERAKRALSTAPTANIVVPGVARRGGSPLDLSLTIDANTLAGAAEPLVRRALALCDRVFELGGMRPGDLHAVYASGGTTYLPQVRDALAAHLGHPVRSSVPPELAICLGAAMHAAHLDLEARPLPY